jgi:hypothetical protein
MRHVPIPAVFTTQVAAILFLALLTHPVRTEAIPITGRASATVLSGSGVMGASLTGPFGFSWNGNGQFGGATDTCFTHDMTMFDGRCHPGDRVGLGGSWNTTAREFVLSVATLRGVSYNTGVTACAFCQGFAEGAGTFIAFDVIVPSFDIGPVFTVEGPVVFTGTFSFFDEGGHVVDVELTGRGRVTYDLVQTDFFTTDEPRWLFGGVTYDIAPTPEPATLLLFGTSAAGLGVARLLKRRRSA